MPLKKGSSDQTVSGNIKELMHDYDRKGAIGTSHPASRKKAQKQAVAIAMSKARESGGGTAKKRKSASTTGRKTATRSKASSSTSSRRSTSRRSSSE